VAVTVSVLSAGSGSGVALSTVAVLEIVPRWSPSRSAMTVIVTGSSSGSREPSEHRSVLSVPTASHVPAVVVDVAPLRATSSTSSTVTSVAADGPSLSTARVYVTVDPGTSTGGETVLTMETSAEGAAASDTAGVRSASLCSAEGGWTGATAGLDAGRSRVGRDEGVPEGGTAAASARFAGATTVTTEVRATTSTRRPRRGAATRCGVEYWTDGTALTPIRPLDVRGVGAPNSGRRWPFGTC